MKMKNTILIFFVLSFSLVHAQISDFKNINFTRADNISKLNEGESIKNLPLLCYKLTNKLDSEVEKFRAIYTWVSTNIKGDNSMHRKVRRTRGKLKGDSVSLNKWNRNYKKTVFKTLIKRKKTMCTGYAYLIKEMARIINIDSKIIDGYGRSVSSNVSELGMPNHSWNAVKLNNKWYLCDATWSSGYMNENGSFIKDYNDGYFLADAKLFSKDHFPIHKTWLLNSSLSSKQFVEAPLVYGKIFKHKTIPVLPLKMEVQTKKGNAVNFKLKLLKNNSSKKISLVSFLGSNQKKLPIYEYKKEGNIVQFKHDFNWKGNYDIHLKVNNDIVATYTVKVK